MIKILSVFSLCILITSCTPKSDFDFITEEVLKHKEGIDITITQKDTK